MARYRGFTPRKSFETIETDQVLETRVSCSRAVTLLWIDFFL